MSKRGAVENWVFLAVLVVALIGLYIVLSQPSTAPQQQLPVAMAKSVPSGQFAVPAAKEYGGAVRGISVPGMRAFPGRAVEAEVPQYCYTCSCPDGLTTDYTTVEQEPAQNACRNYCIGGQIISSRPGTCL